MKLSNRWIVVLLIIASSLPVACVQKPAATKKIQPVKLEEIEGSDFKRVVLTDKAAERLALQTAPVREAQVARHREVGGQVVASPETGASTILVRVPLSEADLARVDRSQPAVILPLDDSEDDDAEAEEMEAEAVDDVEDDDVERTTLYLSGRSAGHQALAAGQPVRVKLALIASVTQYKIVPYQAVIYDANGGTWVYAKEPNTLAFVRQSITVDYIEGDLAFLTEGPPVGAEVVTVGGDELYGAETGVSK